MAAGSATSSQVASAGLSSNSTDETVHNVGTVSGESQSVRSLLTFPAHLYGRDLSKPLFSIHAATWYGCELGENGELDRDRPLQGPAYVLRSLNVDPRTDPCSGSVLTDAAPLHLDSTAMARDASTLRSAHGKSGTKSIPTNDLSKELSELSKLSIAPPPGAQDQLAKNGEISDSVAEPFASAPTGDMLLDPPGGGDAMRGFWVDGVKVGSMENLPLPGSRGLFTAQRRRLVHFWAKNSTGNAELQLRLPFAGPDGLEKQKFRRFSTQPIADEGDGGVLRAKDRNEEKIDDLCSLLSAMEADGLLQDMPPPTAPKAPGGTIVVHEDYLSHA